MKKIFTHTSAVSTHHDLKLIQHLQRRRFPSIRQIFHIRHILSRGEKIILNGAIVVLCVGFVWLGASIVEAHRNPIAAVGGSYTEGLVGSPHLINPLFSNLNDADADISRLVYSGLFRYDPVQRLVPDLAVKYDVSDDKKVYTMYLRADATWHDGKHFTAKDVVFTFDLIQEQIVGSSLGVTFQGVKVEALDDATVRFTLQEPFSSFLSSLTVGILPEHVWSQIPSDQIRLAQRNLQPIGTGPYEFKRIVKDDAGYIHRVELTRFKNYYKEVPYIQDFAFEFFGDYDGPDGIVTALREQRIDGVSFVPYSMREKIERKHISLHTLKLPQYTALFFNEKNSVILSEKENRSALTSALDKERIVKEVLKNEGRIIQGPILEGFPGYNPNVSTTIFSQDSANKLLDKRSERISAADYRKQLKEKMLKEEQERVGLSADLSSTTTLAAVTSTEQLVEINKKVDEQLDLLLDSAQLFYRKNKDGSIWELNLVTADTPEYAQAAQLVAGYWQDVGVKVNVKKIDPKEMGRQALKIRDYDVLLYGVIVGGDPDQYSFWHSSQVEYPGLNLSQYESRVVDTILGKIRATIKSEELQSLYTELQNTILDDAPAVFLYTPTYTYALSDKVQGFAVDRIAQPSDRFANVSDWYTKTKGEWKF